MWRERKREKKNGLGERMREKGLWLIGHVEDKKGLLLEDEEATIGMVLHMFIIQTKSDRTRSINPKTPFVSITFDHVLWGHS